MHEASARIVVIGGTPSARGRLLNILRATGLHADVDHGQQDQPDEPDRPERRISVGTTRLTPREVDVLAGLARGRSYQAIAGELRIGLGTVQTYVKSAYRKLGVSNRAEATRLAIQMGLIDGSD
jgi:DNA-binding NarL/FixJ family response regulator